MSDVDEVNLLQIDMPLNYVRGFEEAVHLLQDELDPELSKNEELNQKLMKLEAAAREKKLNLVREYMMIFDKL